MLEICFVFVFFFQAEDGIRDADVTGVQTCALPICRVDAYVPRLWDNAQHVQVAGLDTALEFVERLVDLFGSSSERSEERRVGKECRSRWWRDHERKKMRNSEDEGVYGVWTDVGRGE